LPALIRLLEIDKAEAGWARQEEERRSEIREERWKEVRGWVPPSRAARDMSLAIQQR
jgi:hypothetical protein